MDKIEFSISFPINKVWFHSTDILINNQKLIDLVRDVETPFAQKEGHPNIAGSYMGLSPEDLFPPSRYFFGEEDLRNGKTALFRCGNCGATDCWPLLTKINTTQEVVLWHEFEQPARTQDMFDRARTIFKDRWPDSEQHVKKSRRVIWDYGGLQFEFLATQYSQALLDFNRFLYNSYQDAVTIFKDEDYGWAIFIRRGYEYFNPGQTFTLIVDQKPFPCEVTDESKALWDLSRKNFDGEEWEIGSWESRFRIFYLPNHPDLIFEWLQQSFDVELYLERKRYEIESKLSVPKEFWTENNHCHLLGIQAELAVREAGKAFELTPSNIDFEEYRHLS